MTETSHVQIAKHWLQNTFITYKASEPVNYTTFRKDSVTK